MTLIEKMQWRYATKKYDPTKIVSSEKVDLILEAIRLTASSCGLQPYEVFVITNKDIRHKIREAAHNQSQITDCSHLLVFAAWDTYTAERINDFFDLTETIRNLKSEPATAFRQMILDTYPARDPEVNYTHAAKQAYIGLGTALIAATDQQVDGTSMEGFNPPLVDKILDLHAKGLRSVLLFCLGYRKADEDWLVNLPKVRRPKEQFITWIQ